MKANFGHGGKNPWYFCIILILILLTPVIGQNFATSAIPDKAEFAFDDALMTNMDQIQDETTEIADSFEFTAPAYYMPTYSYASNNDVAPRQNYISIMGRTLNVVTSDSTNWTPDYDVARYVHGRYNGVFYYAHNHSSVFGGLANLPVGSTFTINLNGYNHTYKVALVDPYVVKDDSLAKAMGDIASARWHGVQYSISLMTCAGSSLGNGDATHRTLLFAYEI